MPSRQLYTLSEEQEKKVDNRVWILGLYIQTINCCQVIAVCGSLTQFSLHGVALLKAKGVVLSLHFVRGGRVGRVVTEQSKHG